MGGKPLWHGCCIMLGESRSQKGRGKERELGTEEQTKSLDAKSESLEPKSKRRAWTRRARAWTRRANEKPGSEEREFRTEDLSGGPFKKQIIDKKQVEVPREAQAEQRMRKIEIRRFLLCC